MRAEAPGAARPGAERHPIFDAPAFAADLARKTGDLSDPRERRQAIVQALSAARREAGTQIEAEFDKTPRAARKTVRARAELADATIRVVFLLASGVLHPLPNPTEGERMTVLAVGGYGRMELAPHSDIDLLFLTPWKITPWAESVIESMLYILWDLKLKVGHASRTVKDCLRLGREDYTIRTALLEHRYLIGDEAAAHDLRHRLRSDLFRSTGADFIEAKLAERAERHKRQGGQRYVLEPNVKEGKGGLRDLQTLYWIAKYIHGVNEASELVGEGVFRREEYENFAAAEDFLWAVRCHLHRIAGRAVEKLSFDMQVEVAARMLYQDAGGRRAVEHFMQDYFRHATRVGELTRVFLTAMEARHLKREATLVGLLRRRRKVPAGFKVDRGRLTVTDPDFFVRDKLNILRIFEEAFSAGLGLRFGYRDREGKVTSRRVEPHGLLVQSPVWYVLARDLEKGEPRMFRMDRIRAPAKLEGHAFRPDRAVLGALVGDMPGFSALAT